MSRFPWLFAATILVPWSGSAYIRFAPNGVPLKRPDFANIQFYANQAIAPGITNSQGQPYITSDSDPISALKAALATWNGVSTTAAHFAPLQITGAGLNAMDGKNVFVFQDTPEVRSVLGSAISTTIARNNFYFLSDGAITDTDIIFNPTKSFSTTLAPGTFDLQSVATHELGHSLGANHTGVLGAVMFQTQLPMDDSQRKLSADDATFVSVVYPRPGPPLFGTISGKLLSSSGAPIRGGLVTAVETSTGAAVDGLSSLTDGTYSFQAPPGNYNVYAEPLSGIVTPGDLYFTPTQAGQVDSDFQPGIYGGPENPAVVAVSAGSAASLDLSPPAGNSPVAIQFTALGSAGKDGGVGVVNTGPRAIASGQSVDLLLIGPGIDGSLNDQSLKILGPGIKIRPGSVRVDPTLLVNNLPVVRATLDIAPLSSRATDSLIITKAGSTAVFSGGLILLAPKPAFTPAAVVNAASFVTGPVSPGEIASIFGTNVGPATGVPNAGFDSNGTLPSSLGGVSVTFDGIPAPLFYVSSGQINLQVPYEIAGNGTTNVVVQVAGSSSDPVSLPVATAAPGIFVVSGSTQAIVQNQDFSINSAASPAPRGSYITIFATGQGVVSPAIPTGKPAPSDQLSSATAVTATIGGVSAPVIFGGMAPTFVGLLQVNAQIPDSVKAGNAVPVQITVAGVSSQANPTIAVR